VRGTIRLPALVIWLTLVWTFLWGDFGLASFVAGVAVALLVVWVGRPANVHGMQLMSVHPLSTLAFVGYFSVQLVKSNLQVAWTVISPRPDLHTAIVAVPMHVASEGIVTVVANAVTLTPGTLTVDVDEPDDGTPPVIYVHVLQFADVESVRGDILRLERLAVRAFGTKQHRVDLDRLVAARASGRDVP
jgi:multicomponent Na+:H+ antiporter subunit E